jgi:hypothetical protein
MSSKVVRDAVRAALVAQFPSVQYVEVKGESIDNEDLQSLWMAVDFAAYGEDRISIGSPSLWEETGVARVWVAALTGTGDSAAITHADAVLNYFRNWQDPVNKTRVLSVSPPALTEEASDGRWLFFTVDLRYQRYFYA